MNREILINNGMRNSTYHKAKSNQFASNATADDLFSQIYTNGMQFKAEVQNQHQTLDTLSVFDPQNLLFRNYTNGQKIDSYTNGDETYTKFPNGIQIYRYDAAENLSGQSISLAYNLPYLIYGQDCYGCNQDKQMSSVTVDERAYSEQIASTPGEDYIEIEPVTGLMTKMRRSYTVVYDIRCLSDNSETCNYAQLPFPSLEQFKRLQVPIYNVTEEIVIDHEAFIDNVSIITASHSHIWTWSAILALFAFCCFTLACCFQCIYLMNTPVEEKKVSARLQNLEKVQNMPTVGEEHTYNQPFFVL